MLQEAGGLMHKYIYGMIVPAALSAVFLSLGGQLPKWLGKLRKGAGDDQELLPASSAAYVLACVVSGALATGGFYLFNRTSPGEMAFKWGMTWLSYFLALHLCFRSKEPTKRAQQTRAFTVCFLPFVAGMWLCSALLSLLLR